MAHGKNISYLETIFRHIKQNETSKISRGLIDAARKEFNEKWIKWCGVCEGRLNKSINKQTILDFLDRLLDAINSSDFEISLEDVNNAELEHKYLKQYSRLSGQIKSPPQTNDERIPKQYPGQVPEAEMKLQYKSDKTVDQNVLQNLIKNTKDESTKPRSTSGATATEEQGPDLEEGNISPREIQRSVSRSSAPRTEPKLKAKSIDVKETTFKETATLDCILTKYEAKVTSLAEESDPYEISREYHDIYAVEWKNVFADIKEKKGQNTSIAFLVESLSAAYHTNLQHAADQIDQMVMEASCVVRGENCKSSDTKAQETANEEFLKEYRRRNAALSLPYLKKLFIEKRLPDLQRKYTIQEGHSTSKKVQAFVCRCVEVTWYACIQDPPMTIDFDGKPPKSMEDVDQTFTPFKPGQKGKRAQYIVWPPLRLDKDGPVISKGVADLV